MRILLIATSGIGDTLCLAPIAEALARRGDAVHLLCTRDEARPFFLSAQSWIPMDAGWMGSPWRLGRALLSAAAAVREEGPYDAAVATWPSAHWATALLARLSGAPRRIGDPYPEGGGPRSARWLTEVLPEGEASLYARNLAWARALGLGEVPFRIPLPRPTGPVPPPSLEGDRPAVAIHAGGNPAQPFKRWAPARFAEVAQALAKEGFAVWVVGDAADRPEAEEIARRAGPGARSAAGAFTLAQTAHLLARCRLLVANDTALGHLAAGLGIPVVSVFGPTSDLRYAPSGDDARVVVRDLPCRPCHVAPTRRPFACRYERPMACLEEIALEAVIAAARDVLSRRKEAARP